MPDPASVHRLLLDRGLTVAVAESLTGGLLSAALTMTAGSSATFRGGLVVYSTDLKTALADVPQPLLDVQSPVSAAVASALAGSRTEIREAAVSAALGLLVTVVTAHREPGMPEGAADVTP